MRHMAKLGILFVVLVGIQGAARAQGAPGGIEQSVVKIVNQSNRFSWYEPWASGSTGKGTGSGFLISKNRIMTNAHVVSDSATIATWRSWSWRMPPGPKKRPRWISRGSRSCARGWSPTATRPAGS